MYWGSVKIPTGERTTSDEEFLAGRKKSEDNNPTNKKARNRQGGQHLKRKRK